jgi:hypothetical protein
LAKVEIEVPDEIAKFLDAIHLGAKANVERGLATWIAGDLDACDDLDVWFDVGLKLICSYLCAMGAGNDVCEIKAGLKEEPLLRFKKESLAE